MCMFVYLPHMPVVSGGLQIGSQRVHSTRGPQPPPFSGSDSFVATATQEEISAALAALRVGSSPQHHIGQQLSAASFPPGGSNGFYQNHSAPTGDSQGFPLSHLNPAMQQHLLALASVQAPPVPPSVLLKIGQPFFWVYFQKWVIHVALASWSL